LPVFLLLNTTGQNTVIKGKVTEKQTGNPIPYANIIFTGSFIGTTSDINGDFYLSTAKATQTIEISAIGFKKQTVSIKTGDVNTIYFVMEEEVFALDEIKILPGENPAHPIFRNIIANKENNNPVKLPPQVSIIGDSLREVTVQPQNSNQDLFHVAPGNYITELSFTGTMDPGKAVVAFDPDTIRESNQSPYINN